MSNFQVRKYNKAFVQIICVSVRIGCSFPPKSSSNPLHGNSKDYLCTNVMWLCLSESIHIKGLINCNDMGWRIFPKVGGNLCPYIYILNQKGVRTHWYWGFNPNNGKPQLVGSMHHKYPDILKRSNEKTKHNGICEKYLNI